MIKLEIRVKNSETTLNTFLYYNEITYSAIIDELIDWCLPKLISMLGAEDHLRMIGTMSVGEKNYQVESFLDPESLKELDGFNYVVYEIKSFIREFRKWLHEEFNPFYGEVG